MSNCILMDLGKPRWEPSRPRGTITISFENNALNFIEWNLPMERGVLFPCTRSGPTASGSGSSPDSSVMPRSLWKCSVHANRDHGVWIGALSIPVNGASDAPLSSYVLSPEWLLFPVYHASSTGHGFRHHKQAMTMCKLILTATEWWFWIFGLLNLSWWWTFKKQKLKDV